MDEKAFQEWAQGERVLDARSDRQEGNVTFKFSRDSEKPSLRTDSDRSSPKATKALVEKLASPEGWEFTVTLRTFHLRYRDPAYL